MYTSELLNPIIYLESRPGLIKGLNGKVFLGWVSLISSFSCDFIYVYLLRVPQFSVIENSESSVSFLGLNMSRFIY